MPNLCSNEMPELRCAHCVCITIASDSASPPLHSVVWPSSSILQQFDVPLLMCSMLLGVVWGCEPRWRPWNNLQRPGVVLLWLVGLFWAVTAATGNDLPAKRNLLLVVVRGLGAVVEPYGSEESSSTPNLRSLAVNSTVFHRVYANSPNWHSSRISLLSGMRMPATGVFAPRAGQSFRNSLQPSDEGPALTMPQWFKSLGYVTQAVGEVFPAREGASSSTPACQSTNDPTDGCQDDDLSWSKASTVPESRLSAICSQCLSAELSPATAAAVQETQCATTCIGDYWAASYASTQMAALEADKTHPQSVNYGKPWLLAVGMRLPSFPLVVPKSAVDEARVEGLPLAGSRAMDAPYIPAWPENAPDVAHSFNWGVRKYGDVSATEINGTASAGLVHGATALMMRQAHQAAVTVADAQIGRLLGALQSLGSAAQNNTVVVVVGDSGTARGDRGAWRQQVLDETTLRTVLMIQESPQGPPCREESNTSSLCTAPGGLRLPSAAQDGSPPSAVNGARTLAMAELVDVWPTLAELLLPNASLPTSLDGRSLVKAMRAPVKTAAAGRRLKRHSGAVLASQRPHLRVAASSSLDRDGVASAAHAVASPAGLLPPRPLGLASPAARVVASRVQIPAGWPRPSSGLGLAEQHRAAGVIAARQPMGAHQRALRLQQVQGGVSSLAVPALPLLEEPAGHRQTVFSMMPRDPFCKDADDAYACQTTGDPTAWGQGTGGIMGVSALSSSGWRLTEWVQYNFVLREPSWPDAVGTTSHAGASAQAGSPASNMLLELYDFRGDSGAHTVMLGGASKVGAGDVAALVERFRLLLRSGADSPQAFDPSHIPSLASDVVPTAAPTTTPSPTCSPTSSSSASVNASATASPSPSPNASATASTSPSPPLPTPSASFNSSSTPNASFTPSPSVTASVSVAASTSPSPSASPSPSPSPTAAASASSLASANASTASTTVTPTQTLTASRSPSTNATATGTAQPSPTVTGPASPSPNASTGVGSSPTTSAATPSPPSPSPSIPTITGTASSPPPSATPSPSWSPTHPPSANSTPAIDVDAPPPGNHLTGTTALSDAAIIAVAAAAVVVGLGAIVTAIHVRRGGRIGPFGRGQGDRRAWGGSTGLGPGATGGGGGDGIQRRKARGAGPSKRRKGGRGAAEDSSRQRRISRLAGVSGAAAPGVDEFAGLMASPLAVDTAESANGRPLDVGIRVPSRSAQGRGGVGAWASGGRAIATRTNPVAAAARARRAQSRRRSLSGGEHSPAARWSKADGDQLATGREWMAASAAAVDSWAGGRVV